MLQAFIIILREGFEAFLIVAIIYSYLKKTGQASLLPAVYAGIFMSVIVSGIAGYLLLQGANQPFWEGVLGVVAAFLVTWLVVIMLKTAPTMKQDMEKRLASVTVSHDKKAFYGVFFFTLLMIAREGMETALLLIQIHEVRVVMGIFLGLLAAAAMAVLWVKFGRLINLKLFFQVTALFLLLFVAQILLYSFHEFSEAGILPNSEALHLATEPFSPDGIYGKWLGIGMIGICAIWLVGAWIHERLGQSKPTKN
jgi:high-affinity iron transporter